MDEDSCPELGLSIQNHFKAIDVRMGKAKHSKHRQSLVTLSRRHSMVQMLDNLELDGPSPIRRISLCKAPDTNKAKVKNFFFVVKFELLFRAKNKNKSNKPFGNGKINIYFL